MRPTPRVRTVEGSCWCCKERRVICDLAVPACDKCTRTGRRCDYGKVRLRWAEGVASRGRLAGKKIPLCQPLTLRRNRDHHLLYFENELLPRFNVCSTVPRVDLDFLSRDPILSQSIVAIANAHHAYAFRTPSQNSSVARIQDRNNALRVFRTNLTTAQADGVNNSLFMANVLLCILDGMIEPVLGPSAAAHHHLVGGKAILNHWGGDIGIFSQKEELPVLMLSIFTTMDLTHSLLIGEKPYLAPSSWRKFGDCEAWWGTVAPDDDFLQTLAILSNLATLGYETRHLHKTIPIRTLLSTRTALEQLASRRIATDGGDKRDGREAWGAFCAVYQFTASVYLYRALSGLDVRHPLIQEAVTGFMGVVTGVDLTSNLHHCILFPLLVVGTLCMDETQRRVIRQSIEQTSSYLSFEGLRPFKSFLEKSWAELDTKPEDCIQSDWCRYFEDISAATCLF